MKRNLLLIICCLLTLGWSTTVEAATGSLSITANSSVTINKNYDVSVKYSGTTLGSLTMKVGITNATCSISSSASGGTSNAVSGGYEITFFSTSGYKTGTTLVKLSCKSSKTGTTKITAASVGGDAYDIEGIEEITVSSASKSITVNAATTTSKKTTPKKTSTTKGKTSTTSAKIAGTITTTRPTTNVVEHPTNPTLDMTTTTTTSTTTLPIEENVEDVKDSYKLSSLKVVGYDFEFDKDKTGYHIEVHPSVDEVYILAEAVDLTKKIDNTGTIKINDKEEIVVRVYDEETNTGVSYKILISRIKENSSPMYLLAVINGILALVIIALLFKNKNNGPKIEKYEEPKNEKTKKRFEQTEEVKLTNEKKQYVVNAPLKTEEKEEDIVIDEDSIEIKPL